MKSYNKGSQKSTEITNLIRVISLLGWIAYLSVANINNYLIEAFLLSIVVIFIVYNAINKGSILDSNITSDKNLNSSARSNDNENYLRVFFNS